MYTAKSLYDKLREKTYMFLKIARKRTPTDSRYSTIHTSKYVRYNIKSLNIHISFGVLTKPDLSLDRSSIFNLYEVL